MTVVSEATCGAYRLIALRPATLSEGSRGALELMAEERYLVRFSEGADQDVLRGALEPLGPGQALLRFGNYFGRAELGGRALHVVSRRLSSGQIDTMLDEIEAVAAALPFAAGTPVTVGYARDEPRGPEILYQSYAHLRDGMRGIGVHDLPGAVERVLAQPHDQLTRGTPTPRPLGTVDRLEPDVFLGMLTRPERLRRVPPTSAASSSPTAAQLGGRLPENVDISPVEPSYDTVPNRFVIATLHAALDVARRFISAARSKRSAAMAANVIEAERYARRLERWAQHRIFDGLTPAAAFRGESTVLRGRSGYKELARWYIDLLARSRRDAPGTAHLLELRDAADIYEQWCYYEVVAAVGRALDRVPKLRVLPADEWSMRVPWGYVADFGDVRVEYNRSFSHPKTTAPEIGQHSYSVRLRPDITVHTKTGLHLLDAKLKREIRASFDDEDDDAAEATSTFKKADLHKMHAYRDALGASSVWILYPGDQSQRDEFASSWSQEPTPQGVGALSLTPGQDKGELDRLVREMLG